MPETSPKEEEWEIVEPEEEPKAEDTRPASPEQPRKEGSEPQPEHKVGSKDA